MVNSILRANLIIEQVGKTSDGLSHTQINDFIHIPKSSLSRLLAALVRLEYLSFDTATRRYTLGPKFLAMAGRYLSALPLFQIGQTYVNRLSSEIDESVTLAVPHSLGAQIIGIEKVHGSIIRPPYIGAILPLHATAAGLALLAFYEEAEIRRYLASSERPPITPCTITDRDELLEELEKIRGEGLAFSREAFREHVISVGAPVFDLYRKVVASLTVSYLTLDHTEYKEAHVKHKLKVAAGDFSRQLGYDPGRAAAVSGRNL